MFKEFTYRPFPVRDEIAPILERTSTARGEELTLSSNGSAGCFGGWRAQVPVEGGTGVSVEVIAEHKGLDHPEDVMRVTVFWAQRDEAGGFLSWDAWGRRSCDDLMPTVQGPGRIKWHGTCRVPPKAEMADICLFFRWSPKGQVRYVAPSVVPAEPPKPRRARVSVVTGPSRLWDPSTERDLDFHLGLTDAALADDPDFIGYPEVITRGTVPGKQTDRVARLASDNYLTVGLPMFEEEGKLVYNSVILIGPTGDIIGKYRKVHLAYPSEILRGITAGTEFPVFETHIGRLGMNICMDSSVPESSLMVAAQGAEALFMPIMGDVRADRTTLGPPIFSFDRWLVIQRCRALDAQLYMLIARNEGQGSCVIDPWGEVLVLNEGDRGHVTADIELGARRTTFAGSDIRAVMRLQRRPHLYADLADPHKMV